MLIVESTTDISTPTGVMRLHWFVPTMPGWQPGRGKFAGIVVYSEIYQVTEPIKRFCRTVSGQGYIVAAPEIYHEHEPAGTALPYDNPGTDRGNALKVAKPVTSYDSDAKAAINALVEHPQCTGAVGVAGICVGGHLAYRACLDSRVRCAALIEPTDIHSGSLGKGGDDSLAKMADVKKSGAELVWIFGHLDNHIPHEGRTTIRTALQKHEIPHTFVELHSVQHAFIRDELSKGRYDPAMAAAAMGIVWELFSRRLRVEWEVERDEREKGSRGKASL
ncbi:dienelactone hydrolase family protein [Gonapodya prolifera JEL478]|uniref:Dienelactone hydrolase family protein n=1 Tax=Gonapodya prolifera (strain JEL478) TaxID=1344416 RepID=A0A139B0K8_GONPJ|nr:dienelactone hydrolase family protein [Gonapodya prolifera JEL478]|eukprot:KXS22531.1 dienelactone hydrolase family protein [Gonapodya prolifera JEL478]